MLSGLVGGMGSKALAHDTMPVGAIPEDETRFTSLRPVRRAGPNPDLLMSAAPTTYRSIDILPGVTCRGAIHRGSRGICFGGFRAWVIFWSLRSQLAVEKGFDVSRDILGTLASGEEPHKYGIETPFNDCKSSKGGIRTMIKCKCGL